MPTSDPAANRSSGPRTRVGWPLALASWAARVLASILVLELALRLLLPLPVFKVAFQRGLAGSRIAALGPAARRAEREGRRLDARLGWTNDPGETFTDGVVEHVSSQRLRGTRLYASDKPSGVTRVEVFGDSFTFGTEVDDDSTYAAMLERRRQTTEVLNFGVPGYGLDQALLRFRLEGRAYHPDYVVVAFLSLLPDRDARTFTFYHKPYFVLSGGQLALRGIPVPDLTEAWRDYDRSSRILDVWRMLAWDGRIDPDLDRELLVSFVTEIRGAGAHPILMRCPLPTDIDHESIFTPTFRAACAATGATCVDATAAFREARSHGDNLFARIHYNAAGNRLVADALDALLPR